MSKGDIARAVQFSSRSTEVEEHNLSLILATGSERQKRAHLVTLSRQTYVAVSLHVRSAPSDPQALRLSLTTILRRKGRVLDAITNQVTSLRNHLDPQGQKLFDQLSSAQSQLSALMLGGPGRTPLNEYRAAISLLEEKVEQLQDAISRRSGEFRQQTQPVTIEQVQQTIPPGAALVEFFSYRQVTSKARPEETLFGPAHYVAYVLCRAGEPLWADLGEASSIDGDVSRLLVALRCPQTVDDIRECPAVTEVKRLSRVCR
jgi:hypothetical protein